MVKDTANLGHGVAALLIGDPALRRRHNEVIGQVVVDLGRYWHDWTGLPFVYALWAVRRAFAERNRQLVKDVADLLKQSLGEGIANIGTIARRVSLGLDLEQPFLRTYFRHLHYQLDHEEAAGLSCFFDRLKDRGILRKKVSPSFFLVSGDFRVFKNISEP